MERHAWMIGAFEFTRMNVNPPATLVSGISGSWASRNAVDWQAHRYSRRVSSSHLFPTLFWVFKRLWMDVLRTPYPVHVRKYLQTRFHQGHPNYALQAASGAPGYISPWSSYRPANWASVCSSHKHVKLASSRAVRYNSHDLHGQEQSPLPPLVKQSPVSWHDYSQRTIKEFR
jgi:hypothetical protein